MGLDKQIYCSGVWLEARCDGHIMNQPGWAKLPSYSFKH